MSQSEVPPNGNDDPEVDQPVDDGSVEPLRSVHTSNLPEILEHLGCSLMVSTYQAGRLVMLRAQDGVLNTHFRSSAHSVHDHVVHEHFLFMNTCS